MLRLPRVDDVLARLFPSASRSLQSHIDQALGLHQTPVAGPCGEAGSAAGHTPTPVRPPAGVGQTPEDEGAAPQHALLGVEPQRRPSPSGPPASEQAASEPIHPSCRYLFEDHRLAVLLADWSKESQA